MVMPVVWARAIGLAVLAVASVADFGGGALVKAQTAVPTDAAKDDCQNKKSEPATPVEKGEASGSKNIGATGWSGGGLGGSHNQTTNSGATPSSPTAHPETATGLDPTKSPPQRTATSTTCENG
jgi:hypothetical protein